MNTAIQSFLTQMLTVVGGLALAYLTLYIAKAKAKLTLETNKIGDDKAKALVETGIDRINDLVLKCVGSAEQTLILDIKKQIVLGTASKDDLLDIGKNVADTVYSQLSKDTVDTLNLEMNDLKGYIVASVENQILALKGSNVVTQAIATNSVVTDIINTKIEADVTPVQESVPLVEASKGYSDVITKDEVEAPDTVSKEETPDNIVNNSTEVKSEATDVPQESDEAVEDVKVDNSVTSNTEDNVATETSEETKPEITLGILPENQTTTPEIKVDSTEDTILKIQGLLATITK